jgi:hypothetical protein
MKQRIPAVLNYGEGQLLERDNMTNEGTPYRPNPTHGRDNL